MKIKIAVLFLIFGFVASTLLVTELAAQKAPKPLKGVVVSFDDIVKGGTGKVTKDQAKELTEKGSAMVFKVGKKIYFVYNEDGTFASKLLAKYASSEFVGIVGKTKTVNGINIIIASKIEMM